MVPDSSSSRSRSGPTARTGRSPHRGSGTYHGTSTGSGSSGSFSLIRRSGRLSCGRIRSGVNQDSVDDVDYTVLDQDIGSDDTGCTRPGNDERSSGVGNEGEGLSSRRGVVGSSELGRVDDSPVDNLRE
jgi:hypothetical protein